MIAWKIVGILLLVALNAFFVAGEFALVSLRRTRIKEMVSRGSRRAVSVQKAVSQLSLMLSGTQLGVTLTALGLGALFVDLRPRRCRRRGAAALAQKFEIGQQTRVVAVGQQPSRPCHGHPPRRPSRPDDTVTRSLT